MATVRTLTRDDVDAVVQRIARHLDDDAERCAWVNPGLDVELLRRALTDSRAATWVALDGDRVTGHLYGAVLEGGSYPRGVWVGPDGASWDDVDTLADLYAVAGQEWIDQDALDHYVWVLDDEESTRPWYELGFARMHVRGVLALEPRSVRALATGYSRRAGTLDDLDLAVRLTQEIDRAQAGGPSFLVEVHAGSLRHELAETLSDPEVAYHLVEHDGVGVAQCITFPLEPRRGSYDATLHLSAVAVLDEHQGRGVASALVDAALSEALDEGYEFVETNWRVTNRRAQRYWTHYGFHPTYVRLHRRIGS